MDHRKMKKLFLIQSADTDGPLLRYRMNFDDASLNITSFSEEIKLALHTEVSIDIEVFDSSSSKFCPLDFTNDLISGIIHENRPTHLLVHIHHTESYNKANVLLIKGRQYDVSNGLDINGRKLFVSEPGKADLGTGLTSWDGSVVLAKYFEHHASIVKGKMILEVGAGTGIAGMAASLLDAQFVYLTDLPYTLVNLQTNVQLTKQANLDYSMQIDVGHVDWMNSSTYPIPLVSINETDTTAAAIPAIETVQIRKAWDIIIGADVVWLEDLVIPLVETLFHCAVKSDTVIYLAHQVNITTTFYLNLPKLIFLFCFCQ